MNMKKLISNMGERLKFFPESPRHEDRMCRLRVYTFQEDAVWYLHVIQKRSLEELRNFYSCQYRQRLDTKVPYNAAGMKQAYQEGTGLLTLTGYMINQSEIIEIEDWPRPVFFYVQPGKLIRIQVEGNQRLCQLSIH